MNTSAALIPCYNDDYSIFICIQLIAPYVDEVIVIDDNSTDSSQLVVEFLCNRYSNIKGFRLKKQSGWTKIRNILPECTDARHLFFIDADDFLYDPSQIEAIIKSKYIHVNLGLLELMGDFYHGTGRGFNIAWNDCCHCYIDRDYCQNFLWYHENTFTKLATNCPKKNVSWEIPFLFHAKTVKADSRIWKRQLFREWIRKNEYGDTEFEKWLKEEKIDKERLSKIVIDSIKMEGLMPIPKHINIPNTMKENDRFELVIRDNKLVGRIDHGWLFQ